jgi:DNA modification methylase
MPKKATQPKQPPKRPARRSNASDPVRRKPAVEVVELDAAIADKDNARKHTKANREAIGGSMREYGAARSVVLDGKNIIRAGNGTLAEARAAGVKRLLIVDGDAETLVAVRRADWTDNEAAGYAIADNRAGELARWEDEQLRKTLATLKVKDEGLAKVIATLNTQAGGDTVEGKLQSSTPRTDAAHKSWKVKRGQLWSIKGKKVEHRLLCGDSTQREDLAKLLGKLKAELMVTDPPYGVAYQSSQKTAQRIEGDLSESVIPLAFACSVEHALDKNARLYLFGGVSNFALYAKLWDYYLGREPGVVVWAKDNFVLRALGYHCQFELLYWGAMGVGGAAKFWYGDRKQSDVWNVARENETDHPNEKPVEVFARPMRNSAPPGGIVFDPFCGSGASMVAAEQTGRRLFAVDMAPKYCSVILDRMAALGCECKELKP